MADLTLSGKLKGNRVTNLLDEDDQLISDFKIANAFATWSLKNSERWPVKFSVFGYLALKLDCEPAPLILGFVLGPMMEENLRRALLISRGDPMVFVREPISLMFLLVAVGLLVVVAAPVIRRTREQALKE